MGRNVCDGIDGRFKCKKSGRAQEEFMWLITKTNKMEPRTLVVEVVDRGGKKVDVGITYSGKL